MKKYLSRLLLSAMTAWMLTGISGYAANVHAAPTPEQLLQMIPADLQQQAKNGSRLLENEDLEGNGVTIAWGENDGTNYILKLSYPGPEDAAAGTVTYGVFDFAENQWRIPCRYDGIYFIPDHRYFLVMQGEEKSVCYEAEADGTVHPEPLPIDGKVCGVDRQGYVTLCRTFELDLEQYGQQYTVPYCMRALLDNHYQMVLDYVVGSDYPAMIGFRDGVAMIRTGGTGFAVGKFETVWVGSSSGYINRKGEWVGRHDYLDPFRFVEDGSNDRVWSDRGDGRVYWVVEDGGEVELESLSPEVLRDKSSDWAKEAIEQAKARGLISKGMQGYYTLDAYREELCSLLVNLCQQLGRELPALDTAPTFIDCEREHVRIAAALGIVSGNADGEIHPRSRITRQEAADMLYRFTALFRELDSTPSAPYPDDAAIDSRFRSSVYAMQNLGIMNGVPGGSFAPNDYYSIEQAVFAVNRLYDVLSK